MEQAWNLSALGAATRVCHRRKTCQGNRLLDDFLVR